MLNRDSPGFSDADVLRQVIDSSRIGSHASRGDQILNARSFEKQGFSVVLEEEQITTELLVKTLVDLYHHRQKYIDAMEASPVTDSVAKITNLIEETVAAHSD